MSMLNKEKGAVEDVLSSIRDVMSGKLTRGQAPKVTQNANEKNTLILSTAIQEDGTIKDLSNKEAAMTKKNKIEPQMEQETSWNTDELVQAVTNIHAKSPADMMISPETVAESVAALSALATTPQNDQSIPTSHRSQPVGDRTIEDLTRDLLKPMLKDWLDANLPSLVKWIVTEQIEKMIKQQQLQSK
jgi:cell pole-organizing protein PopZ